MTFHEFLKLICVDAEAAKAAIARNSSFRNLRNGPGETALHWFCVEDDLPRVRLLFSMGFDLDSVDSFGSSPLMHAVRLGYRELACWLLDQGADVDLKTVNDDTALSYAVISGNDTLTRHLIRYCRRPIQFYFSDLDASDILKNPTTDSRRLVIDLGLKDPFDEEDEGTDDSVDTGAEAE